jgi:hypothetical protein
LNHFFIGLRDPNNLKFLEIELEIYEPPTRERVGHKHALKRIHTKAAFVSFTHIKIDKALGSAPSGDFRMGCSI